MSNEFLAGAASWFGMDPDRLADATMSTNAQGLTLVFKIKLEADDYLGIADRMRALREPVEEPQATWSSSAPLPTLQEVMRTPVKFMDRPECAEMLDHAMQMSKGARRMVEDEMARRAGTCPHCPDATSTQGVGGRTVVHVDVPAEADSGLPDAVWLDAKDTTQHQRQMASDRSGDNERFLIQVAMLTPEQLAQVRPPVPTADGGAGS